MSRVKWMFHRKTIFALLAILILSTVAVAQRRYRGYGYGDTLPPDRNGVPDWGVDPEFVDDTFTFVRVRYSSGGWGRDKWMIDWPDSDLNFSLRLQQLTSLKVNPEPISLELTDPRLFDYPFLYMIEPGDIELNELEVVALRKYLLNGGFMMVDDFWGDYEYAAFERAMKRVFPNREAVEVPLSHEIFQCVYPMKERPQVPSIRASRIYEYTGRIQTWEERPESDTSIVNYRAIFDDKDRIMVFICHNTDLGDGWEREGMNRWYFQEFSVKKAYPMGINIVTYAMTH